MTQKDPYVLVEHTGTKISQVTGFVPEIVAWMAEKYKFTLVHYISFKFEQ